MAHDDDDNAEARGGRADSVAIECQRQGTTAVLVISGELDLVGGDAVDAAVAALASQGVDDVSIQAEDVTFIDSSGVGALLAARGRIVEAGGEFRIGPMAEIVARVIDVAGVSELLGPYQPR